MASGMDFPPCPFWDFSIRVYPLAEVEQRCLELQDDYDLDVNLVLLCYWLAAEKHAELDEPQCQLLLATTHTWQQNIIKPLRQSRRSIKHKAMIWSNRFKTEVKDTITQIEINAEHMLQLELYKQIESMPLKTKRKQNVIDIAHHNISVYLAMHQPNCSIDTINDKLVALDRAVLEIQSEITGSNK